MPDSVPSRPQSNLPADGRGPAARAQYPEGERGPQPDERVETVHHHETGAAAAEAAATDREAFALGVWASGHRDRCGCEEPDGPMCAHPVPFEHTEAEMRRALDG